MAKTNRSKQIKKKQQRREKLKRWFKYAAMAAGIALIVGMGAFFIWIATLKIPDVQNFANREVMQSSKIYDRTGDVVLYDVFSEQKRTIVPYDDIADDMKLAILAIEDDQFFSHNGVRISAYFSALWEKIQNPDERLRGGSTITQQVVKNALLTSERAISRKIKEFVLALRLEGELSKEEILSVYLNEIPFGGSVYGVEEAAQSFFDKSASELTLAESAYLAAIPKAPTFYAPNGSNRDKLETRKNVILARMLELGFISQAEYQQARAEEVEFLRRTDQGIRAPHFVFYVREYLEEKYGAETLERGGLDIYTTLDWDLQEEMESIAREQAERITAFRATNLGLVAMDNTNGHILAMVGSKDYFAEDIDGNFNIATASRQPGSTFKPFVYAAAFEKGYLPESIVWDVQTEFSASCYPDGTPLLPQYQGRCYMPQNYDSGFRGPISLQSALAQSLNIPAVKALYLVGVSDAIEAATRLGITTLNRSASFYGLNLVLGGGEVRLLDMVSAYGVFGNEGVRNEPTGILRVVDGDGEVLEEYEQEEEEVLDPLVANMINDILSDNDLKRPMFGQNSRLYYESRPVAVKTGTTNNYRDTWTVGYTPQYAVGVWVGNNDNTPLSSSPSSTVAGPFWRQAMDALLRQMADEETVTRFNAPNYQITNDIKPILRGVWQGQEEVAIDITTGRPADDDSDPEDIQSFVLPNYHSILHWVNKNDPRGPVPTNPGSDPQYERWEYGVDLWNGSNTVPGYDPDIFDWFNGDSDNDGDAINGSSDNEDEEPEEEIFSATITSPFSGARYDRNERVTISLSVTGRDRIDSIYYYVNNSFLGSGNGGDLQTTFRPDDIDTIENIGNTVKVVIELVNGTRVQREVQFSVND